MKKKTIILLSAALLVYIFFYSVIPVPFVHGAQFFWAFVGGIGAGACIFFAGKMSEDEKYNIDNYAENKRKETMFIVPAVLVGIIGSIVMAFHFYTREDDFIKANPVMVDGVVLDGESRTSRRSSTYELRVKFTDSSGNSHTQNIDVSSGEWNNAGKGMPVKVVYERENPDICELVLSTEDAKKYLGNSIRLYPGLKELQQIMNTESRKQQERLLGDGWKLQPKRNEDGKTVIFYNAISADNLVLSFIGNIYLNETGGSNAYNDVMAEARKSMKVVYDSMSTNPKKGLLLENDSMQLRFQHYSKISRGEGDYNFMTTLKTIYCFGFARKDGFLMLPGDIENRKDDVENLKQLLRQK